MRTLLLLIALLAGLLGAPAALAQDDTEKAKAAYAEGKRLYDTGRFTEAHERFSTAYRLKPAPLLLFNMAQCKRQLKEHERAIFLFRRYLSEDPGTRDRKLVERLIREEEKAIAQRRAAMSDAEKKRADLAKLEQELQRKLDAFAAAQTSDLSDEELVARVAELEALQKKTAELEELSNTLQARTAEDEERRAELARQQEQLAKAVAQLQAERGQLREQQQADAARLEAEEEAGWWVWPAVGAGAAGTVVVVTGAAITTGVVAAVLISQSAPDERVDWR